jgi:transcriptional regulator with XRE-family HTH domain
MENDNDEILMKLGQTLRQARLKKKLTQLDLEVLTGIPEADISRIENGRKNFAVTTLIKLAKGLEIPVSKLLADF